MKITKNTLAAIVLPILTVTMTQSCFLRHDHVPGAQWPEGRAN
jgi:hypothetical protein